MPQCVLETKADQLSFGIDFHPLDGRIYGFVCAHLLSYLVEKNPAAELQPDAPADRLSLAFSTHDVVLLGWRLNALVPLIRHGRLASVAALDSRYYALVQAKEPFICDIVVSTVQKE